MTALTYTILIGAKTVVGSIKSVINHSDVPSSDVLADAQTWINTRLRIEEMVVRSEPLTISSGADLVAIPTGFLDPCILYLVNANGDNLGRIPLKSKHEVMEHRSEDASGNAVSSGPASIYTVIGNNLVFDTKADAAYTALLTFYKKPTLLGGVTVGPSATLDFNDNGSSADDITRPSGSWITDGYVVGGTFTVTAANTAANNGSYPITALSATVMNVATGTFTDDQNDATAVVSGTNIYTDDYRTLLRHAYSFYGFEYRKDYDRMERQFALASAELQALHIADDLNNRTAEYDTRVV